MDEALLATAKEISATGLSLQDWWAPFKSLAALVLDAKLFEQCLAAYKKTGL